MAITASFAADFSAFNAEVDKAETQLSLFEAQTTDTGAAIASMGTVSTTTAPGVNTLSQSFRQFDGVLNAAGLRIGPYVKGLEDISAASGKTVGQLGYFGTAALAVGTAFATFKITSAILEFTGLNKVIGDTVLKIHDFGLAAATAGAKQDVINRAIGWGADATINYTQAIAFNTKHVNELKDAANAAVKAYDAWTKGTQEVTIAAQDWRVVLDQVSGSTVEAAKEALKLGVSEKAVADAYYLTAPQIAAVVSALAADKAAAAEAAKEHARVTAELKKHADAVAELVDRIFGRESLDQADLWVEAIENMGGSLEAFTSDQLVELETAMSSALDVMARTGLLTNEVSGAYAELMVAAQDARAALGPLAEVIDTLAQDQYDAALASDALAQSMHKAAVEAEGVKNQIAGVRTEYQLMGAALPTGASLTAASKDPRSMLGYGTPSLLGQPTGLGFAGNTFGQTPTVNIQPGAIVWNYPVVNDPGAMDQLGRLVGDAILNRTTRTGTVV